MKNIIKISLLLGLIFAGCSEDFLNVAPIGKLSSDSYLNNNDEVHKALIGVYNEIQNNYSNGSWASVYFIKNLPADDCLAAGGGPSDQPEYQYLDDFNITSDNAKLQTIWTNFYKTINACNTIINQVGNKADKTEEMTSMVAEAQAIRAFNYLDLVIMFGGVPLLTENPASPEEYHKPRATKEDVYAQIEADLKAAIPVLKLKSEYSAADKFRFSKGTAQALLGKAYLYEKKYNEAATVLGQVISSGEYGLEPDFEDVWSQANQFGTESLFEVSYTAQEGYDWGTFPWGGGNESNIEVQLQGPRADYFDFSKDTVLNIINGWGFNLPSREIGDLFISEGETSRYKGTLISQSDLEKTGTVVKVSVNDTPKPHDYEGYMRLKYVTKPSATSSTGVPDLNYAINWRILRYADVLLMAAEAYNKSNPADDAAAQAELFKVRSRAGFSDPITATGTALFNMIVKEREIELAFEGSRYWDLIRWGMADQELSDIGFEKGKNELFPIPKNEIIANNAMSASDQNPGY